MRTSGLPAGEREREGGRGREGERSQPATASRSDSLEADGAVLKHCTMSRKPLRDGDASCRPPAAHGGEPVRLVQGRRRRRGGVRLRLPHTGIPPDTLYNVLKRCIMCHKTLYYGVQASPPPGFPGHRPSLLARPRGCLPYTGLSPPLFPARASLRIFFLACVSLRGGRSQHNLEPASS